MIQEGEDYLIQKVPQLNDVIIFIGYMRHKWSDALIVDKDGTVCNINEDKSSKLFTDRQFVVYRDDKAKQAWDKHGWSKTNSLTAMLVILDDDGIWITYNDNNRSQFTIKEIEQNILINARIPFADVL